MPTDLDAKMTVKTHYLLIIMNWHATTSASHQRLHTSSPLLRTGASGPCKAKYYSAPPPSVIDFRLPLSIFSDVRQAGISWTMNNRARDVKACCSDLDYRAADDQLIYRHATRSPSQSTGDLRTAMSPVIANTKSNHVRAMLNGPCLTCLGYLVVRARTV